MVGRPPKPQQIRTLEGNRSRSRIPEEVQAEGSPVMPRGMPKVAQTHWRKVTSEVNGWGICKRIDGLALEQMCRYWALWRTAVAAAEKHPLDKEYRQAVVGYGEQWRKLAIEFGLTPVARTRMAISEQKKTDDFGEFLKVV